jgi:hypothetical protein
MQWLREQRPELVPRYEKLYSRGAYAPREERERLARMVRRAGTPSGFRPVSRPVEPITDAPARKPPSRQDTLF